MGWNKTEKCSKMKKLGILFVLSLTVITSAVGQNQDKKSLTQHILQVAANKVLLEYVKKGYRIVQDGLDVVSFFKRGEYKLHDDYFKSLRRVSGPVRRYEKVGEISRMGIQVSSIGKWIEGEANLLQQGELNFARQLSAGLEKQAEAIVDQLLALSSDNALQMSDDERLQSIDRLHERMQECHDVCVRFYADIRSVIRYRRMQQLSNAAMNLHYGLNTQMP
jgi:hypothetical protein